MCCSCICDWHVWRNCLRLSWYKSNKVWETVSTEAFVDMDMKMCQFWHIFHLQDSCSATTCHVNKVKLILSKRNLFETIKVTSVHGPGWRSLWRKWSSGRHMVTLSIPHPHHQTGFSLSRWCKAGWRDALTTDNKFWLFLQPTVERSEQHLTGVTSCLVS